MTGEEKLAVKKKKDDVNVAFEILLEAIKLVTNQLKESGADALRAGDYQKAQQLIEEATWLDNFRKKVEALRSKWAGLAAGDLKVHRTKIKRTVKGRLMRGQRTPEEAFRIPILEALVELGGRAPVGEVLERVREKMKSVLNQYDLEPLPSNPRSVRWKNTAQWCRYTIVREGLMKNDSPYGIWEISEAGRKFLSQESTE